MGYTFLCDGPCDDRYDHAPAFMGEFRESWIKTSDHWLAESPKVQPGTTFTVCEGCAADIFTV